MFPKDASKYNLVETIDLQEEAVFKVVIPSIQLFLPVMVVFLGPISIHERNCLILCEAVKYSSETPAFKQITYLPLLFLGIVTRAAAMVVIHPTPIFCDNGVGCYDLSES